MFKERAFTILRALNRQSVIIFRGKQILGAINLKEKKKFRIKKIFSIFLIMSMSITLFSCGKSNENTETAKDSGIKNASEEKNEIENASGSSSTSDGEKTAEDSAPKVYAEFTNTNSWEGEKGKYVQYDVTIYNNDSAKITDWTITAKCPDDMGIEQNWNTEMSKDSNGLTIKPADYAKNIDSNGKTEGLGFIVYDEAEAELSDYEINYTTDAGSFTVSGTKGGNEKMLETAKSETKEENNSGAEETKEETNKSDAKVVSNLSALHVDGITLKNEKNEAVRLQGVSTLGLAWYPQFVNEDTFKTFKDDWGINTMRLAMYTQEDDGYCVSDDKKKKELKDLIDKGVKAATDLNLYVIIDWHILSDGNPMTHEDEAEKFFEEMSKKYASYPNVLYEICNEPNGSSWKNQIKPYAEKIIPIIRKNAPDAVIIVGTNTWSQDVDDVISDPLSYENVMYTLHFYAASHKEDLRNKAKKALSAGVPIFISECSICDASGNGGLDMNQAKAWKDFINENGLSFVEWSLSNRNESSAILTPSCTKTSGFTESDYTDSAKFYRQWMRENAGLK